MFQRRARGRREPTCVRRTDLGGESHFTASLTVLPVIGVPVPTRHLGGVDSLHSIVQMPSGVPVATMAIGGAANAALMAVRMLALADDELAHRLAEHVLDRLHQLRGLLARQPARRAARPGRRATPELALQTRPSGPGSPRVASCAAGAASA